MNLFLRNNKLDESLEHEIFSINESGLDEFGFTVIVIWKDSFIEDHKLKDNYTIFNNITEVHHLFDSRHELSIAFESDIHSTGGTRKISNIDTVMIFNADKLEKHY